MTSDDQAGSGQGYGLFSLSPAEQDEISAAAEPFSAPAGKVLVRQDDPARKMFLIGEGRVRLRIDRAPAVPGNRRIVGRGHWYRAGW